MVEAACVVGVVETPLDAGPEMVPPAPSLTSWKSAMRACFQSAARVIVASSNRTVMRRNICASPKSMSMMLRLPAKRKKFLVKDQNTTTRREGAQLRTDGRPCTGERRQIFRRLPLGPRGLKPHFY